MGRLLRLARRMDGGNTGFDSAMMVALLLTGLIYASGCGDAEASNCIAVNTVCSVVALLIAASSMRENRADRSTRLFSALAWTTFGFILADLLRWVAQAEQVLDPIQYLVNAAELLISYLIPLMFLRCVHLFVGLRPYWLRLTDRILSFLCALYVTALLITLPMGLPFRIVDRAYVQGPLYVLFQTYPVVAVWANLLLIMHSHKLSVYEKLSLSTYCLAPLFAQQIQYLHYGIAATSVSLLVSLVVVDNTFHMRHSRMLVKLEQELTAERVNRIALQIQPHFLYNTLTSIANICEKDPKSARQAIVDFSDYLRVNQDFLKCNQAVPFEKELEHCKTYLSLEKMRFEEDLNVEFDIQISDFNIPILSIQPLLENAVKHGICEKSGGGTVRLSTCRKDGRICVEVSDDGVGFDPLAIPHNSSCQHIGLENVRCRIRQMCRGEMTIESAFGAGTKVTISLPEKDDDAA